MAKHIIQLSEPPAAAPTEIGQHAVDTVNGKTYIAVGTSTVADWQEVGAGGGGFGVVASDIDEISSVTGTSKDWNIDTAGPLVLKIDNVASANVVLEALTTLAAGETVQNRMVLMVGESATATAISVDINLSSSLLGNDVDFMYVDSHSADFAYQSAKVLSLQNQVLFFDVIHANKKVNEQLTQSAVVSVVKTGQTAVTVIGTTGGGGG